MEKGVSLVLDDEDVDWWRRDVRCSGMRWEQKTHGAALVCVRSGETGDSQMRVVCSRRTAADRIDRMIVRVWLLL